MRLNRRNVILKRIERQVNIKPNGKGKQSKVNLLWYARHDVAKSAVSGR